ncbi:MAG: YceI family protein [Spirochaetota bacterium]
MKKYCISMLALAISLLSYCKKPETNKSCQFTYNATNSKLGWVAYKYVEKLGVKGTFKEITVNGAKEANSIEEAIDGISFSIATSSVDSGVSERDKKIVEHFFGKMKLGDTIKGKVSEVKLGKANLSLSMNEITRQIPVTYTIENQDTLKVKLEINVDDWQAQESVAALNEVCKELHKGKDGVSKLWPDVSITINSKFDKNCK